MISQSHALPKCTACVFHCLASVPHQDTTCLVSGCVRACVIVGFCCQEWVCKRPEGWTFPYFTHWLLHLWLFCSIPDSRWRHTATRGLTHGDNQQHSAVRGFIRGGQSYRIWQLRGAHSLAHSLQLQKMTLFCVFSKSICISTQNFTNYTYVLG